ncbi:MAG: hypothetical protein FJX42_00630 [Alphaproteobacteria bacterium]|nr:hypothetical protein [Alphaproteobacteria bacterium]
MTPLSILRPDPIKGEEGKRAIIHCASGNRTQHAARMLLQAGHAEVTHLKGGIAAWKRAGLPVAADADPAPGPDHRRFAGGAGRGAGQLSRQTAA